MADMFGAPIGIRTAEQDQRANVLDMFQAQKLMGEIANQPVDADLKKAHTRLYNAEAQGKETDAAAELAFAQLARGPQSGGATVSISPGANLVSMGTRLMEMGYAKKGMAAISQGVTLDGKAATAESARAAAEIRQVRMQRMQLENRANLAQGVLNANSQEAYDAARLEAINQGIDPTELPELYAEAKPMLQQIVAQGTSAIKLLTLQEQKRVNNAKIAQAGASAAAASARVKVLDVREKMLKRDLDEQTKNGGKFSPGAIAGRDELTETRHQNRMVKDKIEFPLAPADPAKRIEGQTYTAASGQKFRWTKEGAQLLEVPKTLRPAAAALEDEDDDEVEDD